LYLHYADDTSMQTNLTVTFHNLSTSAELELSIRDRVAKLERLCPGLTRCHVVLELPHRHASQGKEFNVRVELHFAGNDLVVNRDSHPDVHVALAEAFDAAERKVGEHRNREVARRKSAVG
jgi:ribosome-associated translation inhibitor RaiA